VRRLFAATSTVLVMTAPVSRKNSSVVGIAALLVLASRK
jgi:hypothetical protein